jgi:hypothetical protein
VTEWDGYGTALDKAEALAWGLGLSVSQLGLRDLAKALAPIMLLAAQAGCPIVALDFGIQFCELGTLAPLPEVPPSAFADIRKLSIALTYSASERSKAIFEADKTSFIHFTRRAEKDDTRVLQFGDTTILPQGSVKVLGVTLDKKLAMNEHLSRVITKGITACFSLQAIKGTRPAQVRQLFRSCVLPIIDYAASAWYGPGKPGVVRLTHALEKVRLGAILILRAWKAVSLPILEAEAFLELTKERLDKKVIAHTAKLISLPNSNPVRKALPHALDVCRYISPLSAVCIIAKERLKPKESRPPIGNPP